ncbi:hypothetical protein [Streptomyces yatensis]|uniref:Uncharacterized protein n=1 Tax=Streptomyces yatensis TaxID=155177 RepID=A0ABN2HQ13_9ACTN|nr:hypothetical protein [Streptomyces yatensis]
MAGPDEPLHWLNQEIDRKVHAVIQGAAQKIVKDATQAAKDFVQTAAAKGETSLVKAEGVGASFGFKLFNAEKTVFDLQEILDKRRGLNPETLKASITAVEQRVAATRTSLARTILRVRTEFTAAKSATETAVTGAKQAAERAGSKAEAAADEARAAAQKARHAEEKAEHAESQAQRSRGSQRNAAAAAGRPTGQERAVDVRNIREAEQAIRALEGRISRLAQALE